MEEFKEAVLKAWRNLKEQVRELFDSVMEHFSTKERPKDVKDVYDYLEQKKKSEPFYKALNSNRKPWE